MSKRWLSAVGVACVLVSGGCQSSASEPSPCHSAGGEAVAGNTTIEEDIRRLLVVTQATAMAQQMMAPMIAALAEAHADVPRELWDELFAGMAGEEFTAMLIEVYKHHYSREEISAMLRFYDSDAGRRILQKTPAVMTEAQQAGAVWGQSIAERLMKGARDRGYRL